jgi:L-ascorbate metabolism protein UlaG (beta-lactamase superfamily)
MRADYHVLLIQHIMNITSLILGVVAGALLWSMFTPTMSVAPNRDTATSPLQEEAATTSIPVSVTPISHATMALAWNNSILVIDPVGDASLYTNIGSTTPDLILITDIHGDHLSTSTLTAIAGDATILAPQAVYDRLTNTQKQQTRILTNGSSTMSNGLTITAVPMYNLPETTDSRHTKGRGNGYVIERNGYRVYVAGDTSGILEMRTLKDIDMAFVPMNLPFTMSVEEAADAVLAFKPKKVYPYHYRGQNGLSDVAQFKKLVTEGNTDIEVILLNWYPESK